MKLIRNTIELETRVLVMGVLNVTPDSFSDGGQYLQPQRAVERALEIETQGADILDIGGESTRPGSLAVSLEEELNRVVPVLENLKGKLRIPISIDTTKLEVAREALSNGAEIVNDISGLRFDHRIADLVSQTGAGLILMHSRGTPETMQKLDPVEDIFEEVISGLKRSVERALQMGVSRQKLIIDPGIGFGKTRKQNLELIDSLDRINDALNLPILLGPSRKSFISRTLESDDRRSVLGGTAASAAVGVQRGARIIRAHDVAEMVGVVRMIEEISSREDAKTRRT
jgi:dihydropteroate synthase